MSESTGEAKSPRRKPELPGRVIAQRQTLTLIGRSASDVLQSNPATLRQRNISVPKFDIHTVSWSMWKTNEILSMDVKADQWFEGRRFRPLMIVDIVNSVPENFVARATNGSPMLSELLLDIGHVTSGIA